jgi:hypothetical protein
MSERNLKDDAERNCDAKLAASLEIETGLVKAGAL